MNPYAVSEVAARDPQFTNIVCPGRQIKANVVLSEDYLLEAFSRNSWRDTKRPSRLKVYANLLLLVIFSIAFALMRYYFFSGLCLTVVVVLLLFFNFGKLQRHLIKRSYKSSPYRNTQVAIVFDDEGASTKSSLEESRLRWDGFTEAIELADGVLLFEGANQFRWIPFRCLEHQSDAPILYNYIASRIAMNKIDHKQVTVNLI